MLGYPVLSVFVSAFIHCNVKDFAIADAPCPSLSRKSKKRKKESTSPGGRLSFLEIECAALVGFVHNDNVFFHVPFVCNVPCL